MRKPDQCVICSFIITPEEPWVEYELPVDSISEQGEFEDSTESVLRCPVCGELQQ